MRTPKSRSLFAIPVLFMALGCAKPRFVYEVDSTFQSASYKSVAPDPRKDRIVIREGMRPLNPDLHLNAVLNELESRNYRIAAAAADLWVAVYVLMRGAPEGTKVGSASPSHKEGSGGGHRAGGRGAAGGGPSLTGNGGDANGHFLVIVQLEDRKTGLPVWQGEANLSAEDKAPDGVPLSIEAAVHQLLQPLPARL